MATLSPAGGDRGQLLLSGAFALAVLFVVLALALNTAIFTANQGSQGSDASGGHHALQLRADAQRATAGLLAQVNHGNATSYDGLARNLSAAVDHWSALTGRHEALTGGTASLDLTSVTNGSRIRQDTARSLTNESGAGDWTLVADAAASRSLELVVVNTSLAEAEDTDSAGELVDDDVFHLVVAEADGDRWRVFVYSDEDADEVAVRVEDPDGTFHAACRAAPASDGTVRVDAAAATVGGTPCAPLEPLSVVETSHDLRYRFGANAAGTYSLVVDETLAGVDGSDYGVDGTSTAPYVTEAVYAADLTLEYTTAAMAYRTALSVTPGDRDV